MVVDKTLTRFIHYDYLVPKYIYIYILCLMQSTSQFHYLFKYIIIGDTSVGKSCLLLRFAEGRFNNNYQATLGVEFGSKTFTLNGKIVKVMVWDTAGQETFKSIIRSYYRGAIVALLVYDITNRNSYNNIQRWLEEIHTHSHEHIQIVLIGNKSDLDDSRQIPYSEARKFADDNGFIFYEVSAKTDKFVNDAFQRAAEQVIMKLNTKQIVLTPGMNIGIKLGNPSAEFAEEEQNSGETQQQSLNSKKKKKKEESECGC